jgi:hypothetical protein
LEDRQHSAAKEDDGEPENPGIETATQHKNREEWNERGNQCLTEWRKPP